MFSERTSWNLTANRLASILEARHRAGATILDLTDSNPTRVGIPLPQDLLAPLADPTSLSYEPSARGLEEARRAVADDFGRRGAPVAPDRVLLTASTSEAYAFLLKLLCDPGDSILVPRPSYPLFEYLAGLESVRVEAYPLDSDGGWHVGLEALGRALTPRTRAIVVVHPNNPTGSYLKHAEEEPLLELASGAGVAIVSDEVFADYPLREDPRRVRSLARDGGALVFALGGLSKSCGLPQLKLGWLAVFGPGPLRDAALRRLEVIADTYLSVGTPVQRAAQILLARGEELRAPIRSRVQGNLALLEESVRGSAATLLPPEGGWSAVLRIPATLSEEEWILGFLEHDDVLVHPGYFFDFPREAYLVLSLIPHPDVFRQGIGRIVSRLGRPFPGGPHAVL